MQCNLQVTGNNNGPSCDVRGLGRIVAALMVDAPKL
jgi:hypothetical protein